MAGFAFNMGSNHQILRRAGPNDLQQLVTMMAEFYAESPYTLNPRRAAKAFTPLLADDRLGHVRFIQAHSKGVGYVVVTLSYSMEYGGPGHRIFLETIITITMSVF